MVPILYPWQRHRMGLEGGGWLGLKGEVSVLIKTVRGGGGGGGVEAMGQGRPELIMLPIVFLAMPQVISYIVHSKADL